MAKFKDPSGREWTVGITHGHLKALKREQGLDLREALKPQGGEMTAALDDSDKFLDLMWFFLKDQAKAAGVDRDAFDMLFDRDTTVEAVAAVWSAVWDFYRGQKAGVEARATLLAAANQVEDATVSVLQKATASLTSKSSAGSTEGSSESTPGRSPSAN
jgi:hypothetical protein